MPSYTFRISPAAAIAADETPSQKMMASGGILGGSNVTEITLVARKAIDTVENRRAKGNSVEIVNATAVRSKWTVA